MAGIDIYTIRYCPYCQEAKELLSRKGVSFHEIDASGNRALRQQMIERSSGRATFPQIFIGATHVGGCDDLYALDEAGGLDPLLAELTDRTESKDHGDLKDQAREQPA